MFSTATSYFKGFFSLPEISEEVDLQKPFNPHNQNHIKYIKAKIATFNENFEKLENDFTKIGYMNAGALAFSHIVPLPSLIVYPLSYVVWSVDLLFTAYLAADFIRRYPAHAKGLSELMTLFEWVAKDRDIAVTKDPSFLALATVLAPLAPLNRILLWDLEKFSPSQIGSDYLALLALEPHNLTYVGVYSKDSSASVEEAIQKISYARQHRGNQFLAEARLKIFGVGSSNYVDGINQLKDAATKAKDFAQPVLSAALKK